MGKIRLMAMDLDGTYLGDDKRILPETEAAIKKAAEMGILVIPASGRLMQGMPKPLREAPYIRYYIGVNGAIIYDKVEDEYLFQQTMPYELVKALFEYGDRPGIITDCYGLTEGLIDEKDIVRIPEHLKKDPMVVKTIPTLRRVVKDLRKMVVEDRIPVTKVQFWFSDYDERNAVLAELRELYPELNVTSAMRCALEISHRGADKGLALEFLTKRLGIDPSECMTFGDGLNDVGMLKFAGYGYAMANSEDRVIKEAKYLAPSNEEAGIAKILEREVFASGNQ